MCYHGRDWSLIRGIFSDLHCVDLHCIWKIGNNEIQERNKKMARSRRRFHLFRFVLEVLILLLLATGLFAGSKLAKIGWGSIDLGNLIRNDSVTGNSGYTNIALFGVDSREGALESGNSDTIMICSVNNSTREIKLVSVYRDTYLDTTVNGYSKCNSAYAVGGPEAAINMLNKNLDLDIEDYITVNFNSLVEVIDLLGGVDINLTEGEVQYVNGYLVEEREVLGKECEDVSGPGLQHLNGMQALAYSRIRYIGLDYQRTERQRTVLEQLLEQAGSISVFQINEIIDTVFPNISTSLSLTDLVKLATGIGKYSITDSDGFPFEKTTVDISAGDCVVAIDLAANVSELHDYLFGTEGYVVSETVQTISNNILAETGY